MTVTHAKSGYISKTVTDRNMIITNNIIAYIMLDQLTPVVVRSLKLVAYTSLMTLSSNRNLVFSERELKFMFAICHRPSVCRL